MSELIELERLEKKRIELDNEWASLEQKKQIMMENARKVLEKVTALLEEKIKARKAALEKAESLMKDLEKKLVELQENQEPSLWMNEPVSEVAEKEEESPKQVIEVVANGYQQPQPEEGHKEEKKRKWL